MKYILILITLPLLSFISQEPTNQFIGKWQGESGDEIGFIEFTEDGFATVELQGMILGGKEFDIEGETAQLRYEVNDSVQPIEVDFILTKLETMEENRLLFIVNFISKDSMQIATEFNDGRATEFTLENSITLKRVL